MTHRKCTVCGKDIMLVPSAKKRADRYGGTTKYYLDLFPVHAECQLAERERQASELMQRLSK